MTVHVVFIMAQFFCLELMVCDIGIPPNGGAHDSLSYHTCHPSIISSYTQRSRNPKISALEAPWQKKFVKGCEASTNNVEKIIFQNLVITLFFTFFGTFSRVRPCIYIMESVILCGTLLRGLDFVFLRGLQCIFTSLKTKNIKSRKATKPKILPNCFVLSTSPHMLYIPLQLAW